MDEWELLSNHDPVDMVEINHQDMGLILHNDLNSPDDPERRTLVASSMSPQGLTPKVNGDTP
jgi:hypothetical protein